MSYYLRFALDRVGVPAPQTIHILKREESWVNRQLIDEFQFQFPESNICLVETVNAGPVDLFVLPYMQEFFAERTMGWTMYYNLQKEGGVSWVMLYGIMCRKIVVLPGKMLARYYRCAKLVNYAGWKIRRLRLCKVSVLLLRPIIRLRWLWELG